MRPIQLLLSFTLLHCAGSKSMSFTPSSEVTAALQRGIDALNQFYNEKNQEHFYAVVRSDVQSQIILCKESEAPTIFKSLLKKSGRYILLKNRQIPFFYSFDTQSDLVRKENAGQWMLGGYSIIIDFHQHVIQEGMVF